MAIKVGTEDKKKVYLASGLGVVMLILLVRFLWQTFGPSPSAPAPAAPTVTTRSRDARSSGGKQRKRVRRFMPTRRRRSAAWPRSTLRCTRRSCARRSRSSTPATGETSSPSSLPPAAIPNPIAPIRQAHVDTGPPPPPPPPPINLGFYGYAAEKTGQKQIFLLHGDDIFIASEGDVVDRRYRVVKINSASVQVEDIPYHNTQTLPLRQ